MKMCKACYLKRSEGNLFAIKYSLEVCTTKNVFTNILLDVMLLNKLEWNSNWPSGNASTIHHKQN